MYSTRMFRSTFAGVARPNVRNYATRRVLKEHSSMPHPTTRSFQSTGRFQGQPGLAEAQSHSEESGNGVYNGGFQHSDRQTPPPSEQSQLTQTPQKIAGKDQSVKASGHPTPIIPLYHRGTKYEREFYWQKIGRWKDVTEKEWLSHSWHIAKNIQGSSKLFKFLDEVLPETIPASDIFQHVHTRDQFIQDVVLGIKEAPMSIRLTPHILSLIDWNSPLDDPLRIQFIPMKSTFLPNHPKLTLDSLHEADDSPVQGLVHRYPDKVLFLATSVCGLYCRFCTRSYAVGGNTETVTKTPNKPIKARWDDALAYIASNPTISDVVVSGGDSYYLLPEQLRYIGDALLDIPHIRRFRIASKGMCVSPQRTLDTEDTWTEELIRLSVRGKERGKQVALHTHFNHVNEMSWVTREAAQKLFERGVMVRNQSVLLKGVNDGVQAMGELIRELADLNIQPYYVYQCDLVQGIEDLRTPLSTILNIEQQLRGSIAGFMMPSFVVDLPGGGGKRLAAGYETYDHVTGRSTFVAPAVKGQGKGEGEKEGKVYEYWDPIAFTGESNGSEAADRARVAIGDRVV